MKDIQKYSAAQIATMDNVGELATVIEVAKAAEIFYRAQDAWEACQKAAEIKLRAIHRAGRILLPPEQGGQTVRAKTGPKPNSVNPIDGITLYQELIEEAGVSRQTATIWQKVARVKEELLEAYLAEAPEREEMTINGFLAHAGAWFGRSGLIEWETPQWLFDLLDQEFRFTLDVCALPGNAKCKRFYDPKGDGLAQLWRGTCWMNPPYGRLILDWMRKARSSADNGATVVCLVPARPDTEWWWTTCIQSEVRFIRGRLQWPMKKETGEILNETTAPFPSAVIVMLPNQRGKVVWWDVRPK